MKTSFKEYIEAQINKLEFEAHCGCEVNKSTLKNMTKDVTKIAGVGSTATIQPLSKVGKNGEQYLKISISGANGKESDIKKKVQEELINYA